MYMESIEMDAIDPPREELIPDGHVAPARVLTVEDCETPISGRKYTRIVLVLAEGDWRGREVVVLQDIGRKVPMVGMYVKASVAVIDSPMGLWNIARIW